MAHDSICVGQSNDAAEPVSEAVLSERQGMCDVGSQTEDWMDFCEVKGGFCCDATVGGVTALIGDIPGSRGKAEENGSFCGTIGMGPERAGLVGKRETGNVGREELSIEMKGPLWAGGERS